MNDNEPNPKNPKPEQSAEDRARAAKEHILKSSNFVNKTQPKKGVAIIGGVRKK